MVSLPEPVQRLLNCSMFLTVEPLLAVITAPVLLIVKLFVALLKSASSKVSVPSPPSMSTWVALYQRSMKSLN
jgi:hypothetical protein